MKKPLQKRKCAAKTCNVRFLPERPWQKFHSAACRYKGWRAKKLKCPKCGHTGVAAKFYG